MLHIDIEGIAEVRYKLGILHSAIWRIWRCLMSQLSSIARFASTLEIRFYSEKSEIISSCIYIKWQRT